MKRRERQAPPADFLADHADGDRELARDLELLDVEAVLTWAEWRRRNESLAVRLLHVYKLGRSLVKDGDNWWILTIDALHRQCAARKGSLLNVTLAPPVSLVQQRRQLAERQALPQRVAAVTGDLCDKLVREMAWQLASVVVTETAAARAVTGDLRDRLVHEVVWQLASATVSAAVGAAAAAVVEDAAAKAEAKAAAAEAAEAAWVAECNAAATQRAIRCTFVWHSRPTREHRAILCTFGDDGWTARRSAFDDAAPTLHPLEAVPGFGAVFDGATEYGPRGPVVHCVVGGFAWELRLMSMTTRLFRDGGKATRTTLDVPTGLSGNSFCATTGLQFALSFCSVPADSEVYLVGFPRLPLGVPRKSWSRGCPFGWPPTDVLAAELASEREYWDENYFGPVFRHPRTGALLWHQSKPPSWRAPHWILDPGWPYYTQPWFHSSPELWRPGQGPLNSSVVRGEFCSRVPLENVDELVGLAYLWLRFLPAWFPRLMARVSTPWAEAASVLEARLVRRDWRQEAAFHFGVPDEQLVEDALQSARDLTASAIATAINAASLCQPAEQAVQLVVAADVARAAAHAAEAADWAAEAAAADAAEEEAEEDAFDRAARTPWAWPRGAAAADDDDVSMASDGADVDDYGDG